MNPVEAATCLAFGIVLRVRWPKILLADAKAVTRALEQAALHRLVRITWTHPDRRNRP